MKSIINGNTSVYALVGNPSRHSMSALIHNYLFSKYKINAVYLIFEIEKKDLEIFFKFAKSSQIKGFNITMPFKTDSLNFIDSFSKEAEIIKSVNTVNLDIKRKKFIGFNTDADGFIKCLDEKHFDWENKECLIFGAGGAARSCLYSLIMKKTKHIYICNRSKEKALNLIKYFSENTGFNNITLIEDIDDIKNIYDNISLVVNSTSIGMKKDTYGIEDIGTPLHKELSLKGKIVFEMVYNPVNTQLIKKAKEEKAVIINGIDMLVCQAAYSFEKWTSIYPDNKYLIYLKNYIKNSIK